MIQRYSAVQSTTKTGKDFKSFTQIHYVVGEVANIVVEVATIVGFIV